MNRQEQAYQEQLAYEQHMQRIEKQKHAEEQARLEHEHDYWVFGNMKKYGGSFVKALADLFYRADCINTQKLKDAFPEYWKEYGDEKWRN